MLKIQVFTIGPIETNCYLAYDDSAKEAVLIDPGIFDKRIANFIKSHNIKVKYTINTHGHCDHIGGNNDFGYPVLIHEKDKECFNDSTRSLNFLTGDTPPPMPTIHRLLKDRDIIDIREISFKVIHTPGHTPGSICLECSNTLFTGDTLFCEGVGRTDILFANQKDLEKSLEKIMSYSDDTVIYPGHGPSSTIGRERKYNAFLKYK